MIEKIALPLLSDDYTIGRKFEVLVRPFSSLRAGKKRAHPGDRQRKMGRSEEERHGARP